MAAKIIIKKKKQKNPRKTVNALQLPCALHVFFEVALAAAPRSESYQLQRQTSRFVLPLCIAVALSQSCKSRYFYLYLCLWTPQTLLRIAHPKSAAVSCSKYIPSLEDSPGERETVSLFLSLTVSQIALSTLTGICI